MPFLSLGLHDDKDATNIRPEGSAAANHARDDSQKAEQSLPPEIETLREKLSKKSQVKPEAQLLAASVNALSSSERYGVPTFATFKFGYVPTRGLLYSSIGHELALLALFLMFTYALPALRPQKLLAQPNSKDYLVYLPEIGGGSEGQKSPASSQSTPQSPSAAPARVSRGFAYPAPQAILSDPPNPTNAFQTVQRPLLVHPEPIRKLVPLPNIVQYAETRLPADLIAPKAAVPKLTETPKPIRVKQDSLTHRNAKFKVPVTDAPQIVAKAEMPKLPAAEEPLPEAPKIEPQPKQEDQLREVEKPSPKPLKVTAEKRAEKPEKEVAPPSPAQVARMEMHGKAKEPLLALSPMPLPQGANVKVPDGEARGRFALAPSGTLNPNTLNPGKIKGPISTSPGTGQDTQNAPNAATETASAKGTGDGRNPIPGAGSANASKSTGTGPGGNSTNDKSSANGTGGGTGRGRGAAGKGAGN